MVNRAFFCGIVALALLVLSACASAEVAESVVASALATPTPRQSEQPSPFATPSIRPDVASDHPDPVSGRVTVPAEPAGWDTAATVVRGSDRYLALGWHYEPNPHIGWNGGPRLWGSADGAVWEPLPVPAELEGLGQSNSLVTSPSGDFLLFGNSYDAQNVLRPVVMRSSDGLTWEVQAIDLPSRLHLTRVVSGPQGYLLAGREDGPGGLWLSADGLAWRSVHALTQTATTYETITDIGAGDDGFVAVGVTGVLGTGKSTHFALASADGATWFQSDGPFPAHDGNAAIAFVAPIGGDWVATSGWTGTAAQFWRSSDGLRWEQAGALEVAPSGSGPILVSAGSQLFYSIWDVPVGQPGGWTSADGVTWTPVDLGPDGVLAGAYQDDRGLMLVGAVVVSDDRADAAFWRP